MSSLPEFMNFKLFGKTILVVHIKFGLFLAIHPASECQHLHTQRPLGYQQHIFAGLSKFAKRVRVYEATLD